MAVTYRLVMDDETYTLISKIAKERGVSKGKLINQILKAWIEEVSKDEE